MCKVSIIIPLYNCQNYLELCLNRVLNQSFKDYEVILVNDGSSDNTLQICKKYEEKDSRINVINKVNTGVADSRNYALEIAKGEYIIFIDCDDEFDETLIEYMYNEATNHNVDLVISNYRVIYQYNQNIKIQDIIINNKFYPNKEDFFDNFIELRENGVMDTLWNKIYKTEIIKINNLKFESLKRGEDVIFNMDYCNHIKNCYLASEIHYSYIVNLKNLPWKKYKDIYKLVEKENILAIKRLKKWKIYNKRCEIFHANHLINGYLNQLNFLASQSNANVKENIESLKIDIDNNLFLNSLENYNFKGFYIKFIIYLTKRKRVNIAIFIVKIRLLFSKLKYKFLYSLKFK